MEKCLVCGVFFEDIDKHLKEQKECREQFADAMSEVSKKFNLLSDSLTEYFNCLQEGFKHLVVVLEKK